MTSEKDALESYLRKQWVLEVNIVHSGNDHILRLGDVATAHYRPPNCDYRFPLPAGTPDHIILSGGAGADDTYVPKHLVDEYRRVKSYYGPLKVSFGKASQMVDGQQKEVLSTTFQHLTFKFANPNNQASHEPSQADFAKILATVPGAIHAYNVASFGSDRNPLSQKIEKDGNRWARMCYGSSSDQLLVPALFVERFREISGLTVPLVVQRLQNRQPMDVCTTLLTFFSQSVQEHTGSWEHDCSEIEFTTDWELPNDDTNGETSMSELSTLINDSDLLDPVTIATAEKFVIEPMEEERWSHDLMLPHKDLRPDCSNNETVESDLDVLNAKDKTKENIAVRNPHENEVIELPVAALHSEDKSIFQSDSSVEKDKHSKPKDVDTSALNDKAATTDVSIVKKSKNGNVPIKTLRKTFVDEDDMGPVLINYNTMLVDRNALLGLGTCKGFPVFAQSSERIAYDHEEEDGLAKVDLTHPTLADMTNAPTDVNAFLAPCSLFEFACEYIRSLHDIVLTRFTIGEDEYAETRRFYETYQMDDELLPDLSVQFFLPASEAKRPVHYFVRAFGRLVASGRLYTGADVIMLARSLRSDRCACIGLQVSKYRYRPYANSKAYINVEKERLMTNGILTQVPFEALFSSSCRGVVECAVYSPVTSFKRGMHTVTGVQVICNKCQQLDAMLAEHMKETKWSSLNVALIEHEKISNVMNKTKPVSGFFGQHQTSGEPLATAPPNPISVQNVKQMFSHNLESVLDSITPIDFCIDDTISDMRTMCGKLKKKSRRKENVLTPSVYTAVYDPRPKLELSECNFAAMMEIGMPADGKTRQLLRRCLQCDFQPPSLVAMFAHAQEHMGNKDAAVICELCGVYTKDELALFKHEQAVHKSVLRNNRCLECQVDFSDLSFLKDHINKHRPHATVRCILCSYVTHTVDSLIKHMGMAHKIPSAKSFNRFKCGDCTAIFWLQDLLLLHQVNRGHGGGMMCPICNYGCDSGSHLRTHLLAVHTEEERDIANMAVCTCCDKVFFSSFRLAYHYENHHGGVQGHDPHGLVRNIISRGSLDNEDGLDMTVMGENSTPTLTLRGKMRARQRLMIAGTKVPCPFCRMKFSSVTTLEAHKGAIHKGRFEGDGMSGHGRVANQCPYCPRVIVWTTNGTKLQEHIRAHEAGQLVKCDACAMFFRSRRRMLTHMRLKHPRFPQPPEVEDNMAAVYLEEQLAPDNIHDQNEESEEAGEGQMYQCDECGQLYATREQVIAHIQTDHSEQLQQVHQQRQKQKSQPQLNAGKAKRKLPVAEDPFEDPVWNLLENAIHSPSSPKKKVPRHKKSSSEASWYNLDDYK